VVIYILQFNVPYYVLDPVAVMTFVFIQLEEVQRFVETRDLVSILSVLLCQIPRGGGGPGTGLRSRRI
jgi:hypothetical protein